MNSDPIDIEALRRLADAATEGPWEADHSEEDNSSIKEVGREWWDGLAFAGRQPDAEFIAAARTAVPALLDLLEQAGAIIRRQERYIEELEAGRVTPRSHLGAHGAREALDAAEHRATRAEAQSAIRGRAVVIYRERAREAEARIKAVQDAAHIWDEGWEQGMAYVMGMERGIDDDLDHATTNPYKASEGK